jgi:hypothetical protein
MHSQSAKHIVSLLALLLCSVSVQATAPVIQWGGAQEGIKIGIALLDGFGANGCIAIYVAPGTNYAKNLVKPEFNQALELVLRDSSNNLVELKAGGTTYGAKLQTKMSRSRWISGQLRSLDREGLPLGGVKIDDCFLVSEAGEYELEVRVRLLKEVGKELVPVFFTPMKMKLHLVSNTPKPPPPRK